MAGSTRIQQAQGFGLHDIRQAEGNESICVLAMHSSCSANTCLAHANNAFCFRERMPYNRPEQRKR